MRGKHGAKFGRPKGSGNKHKHHLYCEWCGEGFWCMRPDGATCSPAHRTAFSRWCRKVKALRNTQPMVGPRGNEQWQKHPEQPPPTFRAPVYKYGFPGS